jgi:hypothetical protein
MRLGRLNRGGRLAGNRPFRESVMSELEEAFEEAEEVGLWRLGFALHKFSGSGGCGKDFCISTRRDRPIAEHPDLAIAIRLANERIKKRTEFSLPPI